MLLHPLDLTSALRPALLTDETLLFVQDAVGLYQGNLKLPQYQSGQVYLTSHRACYIDNDEPRTKAVTVQLKDVEICELYAGFLKSSPKVILHPRAAKQFGSVQRTPNAADGSGGFSGRAGVATASPLSATRNHTVSNATWICPICTFSNPVPANFDSTTANDATPLPPCLTCGLKPPLVAVVRAALASMSDRPAQGPSPVKTSDSVAGLDIAAGGPEGDRCPRCTFQNHASMSSCEICGAPLRSNAPHPAVPPPTDRTASPALSVNGPSSMARDSMESLKLSFRAGGEKTFIDRLKGALIQRKWLLQSAPTMSRLESPTSSRSSAAPSKNIGISGLERRDRDLRKNNEVVIGNAFEDLSALMASAKEIIAVAETFAKHTRSQTIAANGLDGLDSIQTAQASTLLSSLNLTTTKDMLGSAASSSGSNSTYLTQLARSVADFLLDDSSGNVLLKSSGGVISLVDLWAVYNRARGGVELVSPMDFSEAVELFDKLKLPVQARQFKASGLRVVRGAEWSDERVIKAVLSWLNDLRQAEGGLARAQEGAMIWGRGVTALEAAERFGWSVGIASEELGMAEGQGALCREVGVEGVKFWENWFVKDMGDFTGIHSSWQ